MDALVNLMMVIILYWQKMLMFKRSNLHFYPGSGFLGSLHSLSPCLITCVVLPFLYKQGPAFMLPLGSGVWY